MKLFVLCCYPQAYLLLKRVKSKVEFLLVQSHKSLFIHVLRQAIKEDGREHGRSGIAIVTGTHLAI